MSLSSGSKLGPYEIVSLVGVGGMGEVYRAKDTRLDRIVAIKILSAHLSSNPDLRQRFDREARTISSLSHPYICALHDVGHQDGIDFLVMEFLEGETLADRLSKGALTTELVLRYGIQIAEAMDKAHRQGIVHRDLKPGNIMLAKSGIKLLDFGVAKYQDLKTSKVGESELETQDKPLTEEGTRVGTVQYMAPEQLEGREADERTDIFALGEILYEMATGRRAFTGKSKASLISAILTSEPAPISMVQPLSPVALDHVVKKCLAKDPDDRWQDARDVAGQLSWISELGSQISTAIPVVKQKKRPQLVTILAIFFFLTTAALIALSLNLFKNSSSHQPVFRFSVGAPEGYTLEAHTYDASGVTEMALSPDGNRVAFIATNSAGKTALCMRSLDSMFAKPFTGTVGAQYPFWSPDGRFIGFFAEGQLKKINVRQGDIEIICDAPLGRGGAWSKDGTILFTPDVSGGIYEVNALGGKPSLLIEDHSNKGTSYRWPQFLPDDRHFLYVRLSDSPSALFLGSMDSKDSKLLVKDASNGFTIQPGYLAFVRNGRLMALSFDLKKFSTTGDAFQLVPETVNYNNAKGFAAFSLSGNGVLSFQPDYAQPSPLIWLDRTGKEVGRTGEAAYYENPVISPDGNRVAAIRNEAHIEMGDIWLLNIARDTMSRFTFRPNAYYDYAWYRDGSQILYAYDDIYHKSSNGAAAEERMLHGDYAKSVRDISPDGKFALFRREEKNTKDLWILPLTGDHKPYFLLKSAFDGKFSPDGKWIVYDSDESGQGEIYVRPFPAVQNGKWQISISGGRLPRWRRDGKELFYVSTDQELMSVDIDTNSGFNSSIPKPLFPLAPNSLTNDAIYDVSADGQRFVVSSNPAERYPASITVLTNWLNEAKR